MVGAMGVAREIAGRRGSGAGRRRGEAGRLRSYVLAVAVGEAVFVLAPWGLIALNRALAWPRWQSGAGRVVGPVLVLAALAVVAHCAALFSRVGDGRPFFADPPRRLVATGLYRRSRNPIYAAEIAVLLGFFLHRGEIALLVYAALFAAAVRLWVVRVEEPALRRRFGKEYERYARAVPRWLARIGTPVTPSAG